MADLIRKHPNGTMRNNAFDAGEPAAGDAASQQVGDTAGDPVVDLVEWLFFAYRDFTNEADSQLASRGFGRAHHRVLHFVNRHPGVRVADLLEILNITKQSLSRVLKQLVDDGYIVQEAGPSDRRERHLYATGKGEALARVLLAMQVARVSDALQATGADAQVTVGKFLQTLVADARRDDVAKLIASGKRRILAPDKK